MSILYNVSNVMWVLQPAPGLANYKLGQKTIISEHYAQIDQAPIYIVHVMTVGQTKEIKLGSLSPSRLTT